jgi:hypothetical protein
MLLGHHADTDSALAGPAAAASERLMAANDPKARKPLPEAQAESAVEEVRRVVEGEIGRVRSLRAVAADPDELRRDAVKASYVDTSEEAKLRHRYEAAHERSVRRSIEQLLTLDRSGADLPDPAEADPEPAPAESEAPIPDPEPEVPAPVKSAPGSVGADGRGPTPARPASTPNVVPDPPSRPTPPPPGAGSTP